MKRRAFLGLLGATAAAPFVVNADLLEPSAPTSPSAVPAEGMGYWRMQDGSTYRGIRARTRLQKGDIVCVENGQPLGVAMANIDAGNYGFVQVGGPASVRIG